MPQSCSSFEVLVASHYAIEPASRKGGNRDSTCTHCSRSFLSSHTRRTAHLLAQKGKGVAMCKAIPPEIRESLQEAYSSTHASDGTAFEKRPLKRIKQQDVELALPNSADADVDDAVANFFVGTGTPFHISRNPLFTEMLRKVSSTPIVGGYEGPSYDSLRDELLVRAKNRADRHLESFFENGNEAFGFALLSDGWRDVCGRPLITYCLATPKGVHFLKAVDSSGNTENGTFIFDQVSEVIEQVGPKHIVAVISDGDTANETANKLLEAKYPHLFTVHSVAHALDSGLERIGEIATFKTTIEQAKQIVDIITNNEAPSSVFRTHSPLRLVKLGETRFYSSYTICARILACKTYLHESVASPKWEFWAENPINKEIAIKLLEILSSQKFWETLDLFSELVKPMVQLIRSAESRSPSMSKIYPKCSEIVEHIKGVGLPEEVLALVSEICDDRWKKMHSPLHAAAYVLEPQYKFHAFDERVLSGFREVLKKMDPHDEMTARAEYAKYMANKGVFGNPDLMQLATDGHKNRIPTYQFWHQEGFEVPRLAAIAQKVTALVSSAGVIDQKWSAYDFITDEKKNRLPLGRANDLVYAFTNARMDLESQDPEKFRSWVDEDASDDEDSNKECTVLCLRA